MNVAFRATFFVAVFMLLLFNVCPLGSLKHTDTIFLVRPDMSDMTALLTFPTWIENPRRIILQQNF
jgi:hypothetical protein